MWNNVEATTSCGTILASHSNPESGEKIFDSRSSAGRIPDNNKNKIKIRDTQTVNNPPCLGMLSETQGKAICYRENFVFGNITIE